VSINKSDETQIMAFSPKDVRNGNTKGKSIRKYKEESFFKKTAGKADRLFSACFKSSYMNSVKDMWSEFKSKILGGLTAAVLVVALCAAVNALDWKMGFEVIVDGENIGHVCDREIVYQAIDGVKAKLTDYFDEESDYSKEPVFVRRIVSEKDLADKAMLEDALLSNIDTMVEAYAVYINDKVMFGVSSEDAADWVFAKYKQKYAGEEITDDMVVDFCEDIDIKKEFMHIALLETPETALEVLSGNTKEEAEYIVQENDTLWDIADRYDTTVEHLLAMNENASDNIRAGMKLRVEETIPLLSVRSVQTVSLTEAVPYTVEKIKDNSIYEGRTVVSRKGQEGSAKVIARVTKINGVQVEKDVLESETITQPVAQVEKIGTKKRPPTTGSGTFINPSFGTLSSRYGRRWNRQHKGIDIAGSYNSPIKAADGGVVTYSGWMSGYGNYVVINHENGYQTAYGHCASLSVKVGDRVAKGDVIAKMGNTGRSTGTHLHFEVIKNGQHVNPLSYVGY